MYGVIARVFVTSSGGISLRYSVVTARHLSMSLPRPGLPGAVLAEGTLLFDGACSPGLITLPAILLLVPTPCSDRIGRFTLLCAAPQVAAVHPHSLFSPAPSMMVLLAWPAAILLAPVLLIIRRDT